MGVLKHMKCPFCGSAHSEVLESRTVEEGMAVRRRRKCAKCTRRFTTFERARTTFLWVIKKDGRREPFDKEKIKRGVLRSVEKRPVSLDLVEEIVSEVEKEMMREETAEVSSKSIGRAILKRLKKIDRVAWLRFASVYFEVTDIREFERLLEKISE